MRHASSSPISPLRTLGYRLPGSGMTERNRTVSFPRLPSTAATVPGAAINRPVSASNQMRARLALPSCFTRFLDLSRARADYQRLTALKYRSSLEVLGISRPALYAFRREAPDGAFF